jgi:hypothetical protein
MANNPLISVGTINRLSASVTWPNFANLNVIPSFLNRDGIRLALDGDATRFLPAMAGAVTSPEPYQMCTLTINLLKTQYLAGQYKAQMEFSTLLGNCTVRPDVPVGSGGLPPYDLTNMAIESVREQSYSGEDAGWTVVLRGTYYINSALWNT